MSTKKNTKPDENIVKLNFDTKKHDEKVEQAQLTDEQRKLVPRQRLVKRRMYSTYQRWIQTVKSRKRTPKDVIAATYKLQTQLGSFASDCAACGLEEYHRFTMQIIEDKIATMVATDITAKNEIVQYIPPSPTMLDTDNDTIVREQLQRDVRPVQFRTYEELLELSFVKIARNKQGFVGFCLHGNGLMAVYKDGDAVGVGFLANGKGVEKLPTVEEFDAALESELATNPDGRSTTGAADLGTDATTNPTGPTDPSGTATTT